MKIQEVRELSTEELNKRIVEEENAIVDLRFAHELKQLTNTSKLSTSKKDIAKLKTILKQRELAAQKLNKEGAKA